MTHGCGLLGLGNGLVDLCGEVLVRLQDGAIGRHGGGGWTQSLGPNAVREEEMVA